MRSIADDYGGNESCATLNANDSIDVNDLFEPKVYFLLYKSVFIKGFPFSGDDDA